MHTGSSSWISRFALGRHRLNEPVGGGLARMSVQPNFKESPMNHPVNRLIASALVCLIAACNHQQNAEAGLAQAAWPASPVTSPTPHSTGRSGPPEALPVGPLPPGALHVRRSTLIDRVGFQQPVEAMHMLVPVGWQDKGEIRWPNTECIPMGIRLHWEARSPDGRERMLMMPNESWASFRGNVPLPESSGCPNRNFTSLQQFFQAYIAHHRPGARILDFRPDNEATAAAQRMIQQPATEPHMRIQTNAEAGQVLIGYVENGVEYREVLSTIAMFEHAHVSQQDPFSGQRFEVSSVSGTTVPVLSYRAPAGDLDFDKAEALWQGVVINPQYLQLTQRHFEQAYAIQARHQAEMNRITIQGMKDRHAINMDTINYVGSLNSQSFDNRMASQERGAQQFSQTMREVQTWVDPHSSQPIELPMHYDHAWRMNDGTFILTNNQDFDPWRDLQASGQRMQRPR